MKIVNGFFQTVANDGYFDMISFQNAPRDAMNNKKQGKSFLTRRKHRKWMKEAK